MRIDKSKVFISQNSFDLDSLPNIVISPLPGNAHVFVIISQRISYCCHWLYWLIGFESLSIKVAFDPTCVGIILRPTVSVIVVAVAVAHQIRWIWFLLTAPRYCFVLVIRLCPRFNIVQHRLVDIYQITRFCHMWGTKISFPVVVNICMLRWWPPFFMYVC